MSRETLSMTPALHRYLLSASLREPEVLARLRAETARLPAAVMQISPEQGQLMQLLVRLIGARRCLEVGTFTGYSALAVALVLPPGGTLLACDVNAEWTQVARRYWREAGVDERITLALAPALETLDARIAAGEAGHYDFVFIDADKGNYANYYDRALALVRPNGLIAIDNTLWSGAVADPGDQEDDTRAIRAFNSQLHADGRVDLSIVPIGDGLTLARKRAA